jgi:hypothetical protein
VTGSFPVFKGNCPKNVARDAKYGVKSGRNGPVVGLVYRTTDGEQWHPTTEEHPDLVEMVNAVKTTHGDAPNGPFYINEYAQVIVPAGPDARYYLADEYDGLVEFEFEGNVLSGRGVGLDGRPFEPGEEWTGPHPGIPYVLAAGGDEIYYESHPRTDVTKKERLSTYVGVESARELAARVRAVKGPLGGRFYVNEWCEMFAPVTRAGDLSYVYIGHLDLFEDAWFPKPI